MLRLYDAEAGEARPLALQHPRLLGLRVRGGPRAHVVGDLVRRLAEHRKLRVWLDADPTDAAAGLNVHPGRGSSPAGLDLDVVTADAEADPAAGRRLQVAALGGDLSTAGDLLAVRLLMLRTPYRRPLELDRPMLGAAGELLAGWRTAVAAWAESPSAPMPPAAVAAVIGALEDDLDGPTALAALDRLAADPAVAGGAKFEAFAYLDLVLGLDLAREVGRADARYVQS